MKTENLTQKTEKYSKPVIIAALALVSVICVFHREPWRDEAQAWLIARDCGFAELFSQMRYEGHPALYQLILFPFAHLGLPFTVCYILNFIFYIAFLYLVLYKCPLPLWQRVAGICACPVFVYSYQARSYMLVFLMLAVCAALYPVRREKPVLFAVCVFLLANTHAYAVCAAGGLFLVSLIDAWQERKSLSRKALAALGIMLAGFIAFLAQTLPSLGMNKFATVPVRTGFSAGYMIDGFLNILSEVSRNLFVTYGGTFTKTGVFLLLLLLSAGMFACLGSLRRAAVYFGAVLLPLLAMFIIYGAHVEILIVFMFFAFWVMSCEEICGGQEEILTRIPRGAMKGIACALCIMILFSLPHTKLYIQANNSQERETSASIQIAEYLNNYKNAVIVAEYPPQATAFVPMLKDRKKVWYSYTHDFGSYVSWSAELRRSVDTMNSEKIIETIEYYFNPGTEILVVLSRDVPRETSDRLTKVFWTVNCDEDESYEVYKFNW